VWIGNPEGRPIPFSPITINDLAATDAQLRALQQGWADQMSTPERLALDDYKGPEGRLINEQLRGEICDSGAEATAQLLRTALGRAAAPADMLLYRGVRMAEAAVFLGLRHHVIIRSRAFVSTSIAPSVAAKLARAQSGRVIELVVRKGCPGVAYVHPFPRYRFPQFEVLINVGIGLKLLCADEQTIRLEVCHGR
jgi:hypothetical protein